MHYRCENLEGYEDAVQAAKDDFDGRFEDAFDDGDDPDEEQMKLRIKGM